MRILVAIKNERERRRIATVLAGANSEVLEAATSQSALEQLHGEIDIAFVDLGLVARAREVPRRIYVIAVLGANGPTSEYWTAYHAGADDVMLVTAGKDEIIGRASALARIRAWARPQSVADRLAALTAWQRVADVIGTQLGELIGDRFQPAEFVHEPILLASEITLTLPSEPLQIKLGFGLSAQALLALQQVLLGGDTSLDAASDAMRELANTAGGAFKHAAARDGLEFSMALPSNYNIFGVERSEQRRWHLHGSGELAFACVAAAYATTPRIVVARDLREGMVLARDVRNPHGLLIAAAGTNLTRTTVERLARLLGATATVEIADAAA